MHPAKQIKHFIQNTLGCSCPEEVFQSVEIHRNVRLNPGASAFPVACYGSAND
jgi:hypothetical protein